MTYARMTTKWWVIALGILALLVLCAKLRCQSAIVLTTDNYACTVQNPCTLQMYRAVCNGSNGMGVRQCPNYPDPTFILLQNTTNTINGVITSTGTKWTYTDQNGDTSRPALIPTQLYGYAATATYNGDPSRTPSNGSATLSIPFQVNIQNVPVYPITGTCRIVK